MILYLLLLFIVVDITYAGLVERENSDHSLNTAYKNIGTPPSYHRHELLIAITQQNLDTIRELLIERSSITSGKYGNYLSFSEIGEIVQHRTATQAVVEWLTDEGIQITHQTKYGEYITIESTVSHIERVFHTKMFQYVSSNNLSSTTIRAQSYFIPDHIDPYIRGIHHFTALPSKIMSFSSHGISAHGNTMLRHSNNVSFSSLSTPHNIREYYNVEGTGNGYSSQATYESAGQTFLADDLELSQSTFLSCIHPIDNIIGSLPDNSSCMGVNPSCALASLDTQYLLGIAENVPTTVWYDNDTSTTDFLVKFATQLSNTENIPWVISIGYGTYEASVSAISRETFEIEIMKASLRGTTFIAASGNDGVTGFEYRPPFNSKISKCGYFSLWPASSIYVTTLGASMGGIDGSPEIISSSSSGSSFTTGGGFSAFNSAPDFQVKVQLEYFTKYAAAQSVHQPYNPTNRGYPDLTLAGNKYTILVNGQWQIVNGTSASTVAFAGMISLINAFRMENEISTKGLGWLNPSIYNSNSAFISKDFIDGYNNCTSVASLCCSVGFKAVQGWDPVSGFGSVDFKRMLSYYSNGLSEQISLQSSCIDISKAGLSSKSIEKRKSSLSSWIVALIILIPVFTLLIVSINVFMKTSSDGSEERVPNIERAISLENIYRRSSLTSSNINNEHMSDSMIGSSLHSFGLIDEDLSMSDDDDEGTFLAVNPLYIRSESAIL